MTTPPPPPLDPLPEELPEIHDLSTPEEVRSRKRRRLLVIALSSLFVLLVVGWFGGKPVVHAIKAWQARRAAAQAEALIDSQSWSEAQVKVQDACQLRASEPEVMRAAERFLTRVGHPKEGLDFLKQLEKSRPLSADEQRDFATDELALGNLDLAETRLHVAWPPGAAGVPDDWRVALQLAARKRSNTETFGLARKLLDSSASTARQRLEGAEVLLSSGVAEDQSKAWDFIQKQAAEGKSEESLEALVALARQTGAALTQAAAQPNVPGPKPIVAANDLAARLEAHPLARVQHRLLALDLQLAESPGKRAELIQSAVQRFSGGDPEQLAALSAWLYAKGEFARVLEILPERKATTNRALYLQYLDVLGALGRWQDIADLISRQKFTLEPMTEQMYLARCSQQLGQAKAGEAHWIAAVDAAGANVDKLAMVGSYAARSGAPGPAEVAFTRAIAADPQSRPPYGALLELLQGENRTADIHNLLVSMTARWPGDDAIRNDATYTGLLIGEDPAAAEVIARDLVKRNPGSLPHRITLALAELRLGHALSALDAFGGIDITAVASQPRQEAIYAAALWQTSNEPEARRVAAKVPADRLLPEEWALLQPIK